MKNQYRALIIGASRGIGLGLSLELQSRGWEVTATRRTPVGSDDHASIKWLTLDINHTEQGKAFGERLPGGYFDAIVINAGIAGPEHQSASDASTEELMSLFMTNTFSPIRIAEAVLPSLKMQQGILAFTSSRLASLNENTQAYMPLYSSSKSALNMLVRALLPKTEKQGLTLLSLHPGWVQTELGGANAPVTVNESARGLADQLEQFQGVKGHHYIDYSGQKLAW